MNKKDRKIRRYSGIQPQYFPRLHYFARILQTDIFVLRDDAQFVRKHKYPDGKTDKSYQAHSPIKQPFGRYLLSIPTKHKGLAPINKTVLGYDLGWATDHIKTIETSYQKAPFFDIIMPEIKSILDVRYRNLSALSKATILWGILRLLGENNVSLKKLSLSYVLNHLRKQTYFRLRDIREASKSKALLDNKNLTANEKILALLQEVGANEDYCGGTSVAAYVDHNLFEKAGITITVQDWKCREYPQMFTKQYGFIPNLSILDLLFNVSPSEARKILS